LEIDLRYTYHAKPKLKSEVVYTLFWLREKLYSLQFNIKISHGRAATDLRRGGRIHFLCSLSVNV